MFHSCYSAARARELSVHGRLACTFPKQAIRNATTGGWAIDPNASEWTAYWDLMMMALLTVVLFLTPYEVAFLSPSVDVLFRHTQWSLRRTLLHACAQARSWIFNGAPGVSSNPPGGS